MSGSPGSRVPSHVRPVSYARRLLSALHNCGKDDGAARMKIRQFRAERYRSLLDVTLPELSQINVFYGPNGSGKSNIIDAIQAFFHLLPIAADVDYKNGSEPKLSSLEGGREAAEWIGGDDLYARDNQIEPISLSAVIEDPAGSFGGARIDGEPVSRVEAMIDFAPHATRQGVFGLRLMLLVVNGQSIPLPFASPEIHRLLLQIGSLALTHIGVTRTLTTPASPDTTPKGRGATGTIRDGDLVRRLFEAKNSRVAEERSRFELVRDFMVKALGRGPFDVFMDSRTKELELRERLPEPNPLGRDIPVDRAGHGVIQAYAIVASILLSGGRLVAIEEPEAHLHAPTLGRELRSILAKMVDEGQIDQLFIATHSNLFDLDPTGYWDVSLALGATQVARKPLDEVDRLHLFEPGPAKHQIQELLRLYGDEAVFNGPEGQPISAQQMMSSLQRDDDLALSFLRAMHSAALQVTGLRAKRARAQAGGDGGAE